MSVLVSNHVLREYSAEQLQRYVEDLQLEIEFEDEAMRESQSRAYQLLEELEAEEQWYLVRTHRYNDVAALYGPFDLERTQDHMARFASDDGMEAEDIQDFGNYNADTPDYYMFIVKLNTLHPDFTVEHL